MYVYIQESVIYILNLFIYTCKYFQNIYCMCVHFIYTQYTYIYVNKTYFGLDNRFTAIINVNNSHFCLV